MPDEPKPVQSRLTQILALENMEGVGRVTARKILEQFGSLAEVRRFPREQILNRLHRVPHASKLAEKLLDEQLVAEALDDAARTIDELGRRQVEVITSEDERWPSEIDHLPNPHRPNVLFAYGNVKLLAEPSVAVLGSSPVASEPFESVQLLVRRLAEVGTIVSCSASDGLDSVIIKILLSKDALPVLVAGCGLAKVPPSLRPSASSAVKAGGLLVSSFQMQHGPFDHDVRERTLIQAALAKAVVFVEPKEEGFLWDALAWSLERDRPVFALTTEALPDRIHVIRDEVDMDWVVAAMKHVPE